MYSLQAGCAEGEHNVMSSLFFKTPEQCLIAVLHSKPGKQSHTPSHAPVYVNADRIFTCASPVQIVK